MVKYLFILLLLVIAPQTAGLEINHSDVEHIEWNSDGTKLLIAYSNGEIVIMDAQTSETIYQTSIERLQAFTWHPVDPYVFAYGEDLADGYTAAIKVYDLQTNQLIDWSGDGSQIATAEGNQIRLWDAETGTIIHTFPFDSDIYALAWRNNSIAVGSQSMTHFSVAGRFSSASQFHWSNDSRLLVFRNSSLSGTSSQTQAESPGWQTVNVMTGVLSTGTGVWPLQPALTEAEMNLFSPSSYIHESPDHTLLIFGQESLTSDYYREVVIANRNTQQVTSLGMSLAGSSHPPSSFVVEWSADSRAAIVAHYLDDTSRRVFYINIPDSSDLQQINIYEFDVMIDGVPYRTTPALGDDFLDLSNDGQSVLLIARDSRVDATENFFDRSPEIVVWQPLLDQSIIVPVEITLDEYTVGSFASDNSDILFFANLEGLYVHDIETNTTETLLPGSVTEGPIRTFSPNGEWLTVVTFESLDFFYLGDIAIPIQIIDTSLTKG